ncbi:vesicle-associated membrane protein 2 [Panthera uncia]|uniref:vesicle-associated membrane protein 2 n=1 Tax=Panthera uncia TaxID=29064 RepID=UPI0020FF835F|nr:vesicle-associated membrane protein 2 [Panthera uncia]
MFQIKCPDVGDVRPPSSRPGQPAPVGASASRRRRRRRRRSHRRRRCCRVVLPPPPPCRLPLPPPPPPPQPGREAPLRLLQTSPVTGDCSRPRPRWMRLLGMFSVCPWHVSLAPSGCMFSVGARLRSALIEAALAHPLPRGPLPQVVDIMRVNVDKVLERDQKLSELDDRADALQAGASQFETSAAKLKRKYWWKNLKMMIILGVICAIILIIIIAESTYSCRPQL